MQPLPYYIQHPDELTLDVVNELEQILARNPYFEVARLLYVKGLYQLQDDRFGPQLRIAAIYVSDRNKLFDLIEAHNYQLQEGNRPSRIQQITTATTTDRTAALIDSFLSVKPEQRKPITADAHTDYMSYLMQLEDSMNDIEAKASDDETTETTSHQEHLIDQYIGNNTGRIQLEPVEDEKDDAHTLLDSNDEVQDTADDNQEEESDDNTSNAFFTETLAQIYIKQGKYIKAMEIIKRLSLSHPQKNRYFADQLRFLEKLVLNQQAKDSTRTDR